MMAGRVLAGLAGSAPGDKLNIAGMINKSKGDFAYNIVDIDGGVQETVIEEIRAVDGVIRVRKIEN